MNVILCDKLLRNVFILALKLMEGCGRGAEVYVLFEALILFLSLYHCNIYIFVSNYLCTNVNFVQVVVINRHSQIYFCLKCCSYVAITRLIVLTDLSFRLRTMQSLCNPNFWIKILQYSDNDIVRAELIATSH